MIDFIYRRIANIKTFYRILFPEPKTVYEKEEEIQRLNTKGVSDQEEIATFYRKYLATRREIDDDNLQPRSPKGKGKVLEAVGESSTSKLS